jgi:hypothetical protein
MAWYLCIAYGHPPTYLKLPLDDLKHLSQCKCLVNSCYTVLFRESQQGVVWNSFHPLLVESMDAEPMDTKSHLCATERLTSIVYKWHWGGFLGETALPLHSVFLSPTRKAKCQVLAFWSFCRQEKSGPTGLFLGDSFFPSSKE